jgi:hypothetical protein
MDRTSTRTIRIRGIDEGFTDESFNEVCSRWDNDLENHRSVLSWVFPIKSGSHSVCLGGSLASQDGHKIATVTFKDGSAKTRALRTGFAEGWTIDDKFDGVTVLHRLRQKTVSS